MRIISLVPSTTVTVAMCPVLRKQLIGCTKFCTEPKGLARELTMVGGTKDPDFAVIQKLKPTHILANDEENKPEHIASLRDLAAVHSDLPKSPADVLEMFAGLRHFLGAEAYFDELSFTLKKALEFFEQQQSWQASGLRSGLRYLYFIWREPYMVVGEDTYISRFLSLLSWTNACPSPASSQSSFTRYPQISIDEMIAAEADIILLSTEPYPFRIRDGLRLKEEWSAAGANLPPIWKIDGQLCSWHGLKTLEGLEAAQKLSTSGDLTSLLKPLSL